VCVCVCVVCEHVQCKCVLYRYVDYAIGRN
jgi:hypothetical protein